MSDTEQKPELRPNTIISKTTPKADEPKIGKPVEVNTDSDITPITRQPIPQVDAADWDNMNVIQLQEQLSILEQRLLYAQQFGNSSLVIPLEQGINQLRTLLILKMPDEIKLI